MKEDPVAKMADKVVHALGMPDRKTADAKLAGYYKRPRPWLKWLLLLPIVMAIAIMAYGFTVEPVTNPWAIFLPMFISGPLIGFSRYGVTNRAAQEIVLDERQTLLNTRSYRMAFWATFYTLLVLMGCMAVFGLHALTTRGIEAGDKVTEAALSALMQFILCMPLLPTLFSEWLDRPAPDE